VGAAACRTQCRSDLREKACGGVGAFPLGNPLRGVACDLYCLVEVQRPCERQPEPAADRGEPRVVRPGQIGGRGEEGDGRLVCARCLREVSRLDRRCNSGLRARQGRAERVLGDDFRRIGAPGYLGPGRFQAVRQTPVEPRLPGRVEAVIDRVADEGMPELVTLRGSAGPDHPRGEQLIQRWQCSGVIEVCSHRGHREKERPGKSRSALQQPVRRRRHPCATARQNLPHPFRNGHQRQASRQLTGAVLT
jgi:hypothetical protein